MDQASLTELLQTLHHELEHGPEVDDESRELLVTVLDDIRAVLAAPPVPELAPEPAKLGDRLREAARSLEESHPKLSTATEDLVQALSRIFQ